MDNVATISTYNRNGVSKYWGVSRGYAKSTLRQYGEFSGSFQEATTGKTYNVYSKKHDLTELDVAFIMQIVKEYNCSVDNITKSLGDIVTVEYSTDFEYITLITTFKERVAHVEKFVSLLTLPKKKKITIWNRFVSLLKVFNK